MSKHDCVFTKEQKLFLEYLRSSGNDAWAEAYEQAAIEADHYRRAYEVERATAAAAGVLLEQYAAENAVLRSEKVLKNPEKGPV